MKYRKQGGIAGRYIAAVGAEGLARRLRLITRQSLARDLGIGVLLLVKKI